MAISIDHALMGKYAVSDNKIADCGFNIFICVGGVKILRQLITPSFSNRGIIDLTYKRGR